MKVKPLAQWNNWSLLWCPDSWLMDYKSDSLTKQIRRDLTDVSPWWIKVQGTSCKWCCYQLKIQTYISSHYVQKTVSCFSFFYFFLFFLTLLYFWCVTASNSLLTVLIIIKYNKMCVDKYVIYTLSLVLFVYLNAFHIKPLLWQRNI